jgi:uncharacterized repeat protein (TIGR01451 family)
MRGRWVRAGLALAVALLAAGAFASAAAADVAITGPPSVNGNQVNLSGIIDNTCSTHAVGYFVIHDTVTNQSFDSKFSLGFPDQDIPPGLHSYAEGPFTLAPNRTYTATAHEQGCGNATGAAVPFTTGDALSSGLADPNVPADVSVTQQASANPKAGHLLAITIQAANNGTKTATDAYVKDFLPPSFEYVDCTTTIGGLPGGWCWWDGTNIVVDDLGDFPAGGAATVTLYVRPTVAGHFVNTVGIGSDTYDPDSTNEFVDLPVTVG